MDEHDTDLERFDRLLEQSSLGTRRAQQLRRGTPPAQAAAARRIAWLHDRTVRSADDGEVVTAAAELIGYLIELGYEAQADRLLHEWFPRLEPGLKEEFRRLRACATVHHRPGPPASFVGRRTETAEVTGLLGRHRIVTIAGPGGAGKTRLAQQVAAQLLDAYPQGIRTIDVAAAGTGLFSSMATALDVRTEPGRPIIDSLLEFCSGRRMLLVLETCEVAPVVVAALVRRLLARSGQLDVLVTTRAPLGIAGEVVWRIPPLSPADAFAMLAARTALARGHRAGRAEDDADLAKVTLRLEGSPQAIELAAARLRFLSAAQLASRLDAPLTALEPDGDAGGTVPVPAAPRHASLSASLDWSYRTLTPPAAALLGQLAVFTNAVDLAALEWCGREGLGALAELADKSMVELVPGPRYRLSAPVRAYACGRLAGGREEQDARDRHLAWSLHVLDTVTTDADGQPRAASLTEFAPYVSEWRAALRWAATRGSVRSGLRLAIALDPWWREHGDASEGRDLLIRLYRRMDGVEVEPVVQASAYVVHAGLTNDPDERARFSEQAEQIARAEGAAGLLVRALAGPRISLIEAGRFDDAEQLCRDVIAEAKRRDVIEAALPAVISLAELLWLRNELTEAAELLATARTSAAGCPEHRARRTVDWLLGMVALRRGDLSAAHDHLMVTLRSCVRHGFLGAAEDAVAAMAVRCALAGDPETAAFLFGGAETVRGKRRTGMFEPYWSAHQLSLRAALGVAGFYAAYAEGVAFGFDRVVARALAIEHPDLEDGGVDRTRSAVPTRPISSAAT